MSKIREQCEGCGMCCRAIYLPLSHESWAESIITMRENRSKDPIKYNSTVSETMDDKTFIIQNWYPLTKEEVLKRNPHIESWRKSSESKGIDFDATLENQFYSCNQLDEETGRCRIHDNLPKVCSGYPWYGDRPYEKHGFYADDCYYKRDITPEALATYDAKYQSEEHIEKEIVYLDKEVDV